MKAVSPASSIQPHKQVNKQLIQLIAWREHEALLIEEVKARIATKHEISRGAKFEKAWRLAWEYGHSSGLPEVENYFDDLVELIK